MPHRGHPAPLVAVAAGAGKPVTASEDRHYHREVGSTVTTGYIGGSQIVNFRPSGDQAWAQQAACAGDAVGGIAPMFPHEGDEDGIAYAKSICGQCPVRTECLSEALKNHEGSGIWGGLTSDERRVLAKQNARKAATARKREASVSRADASLSALAEASGLSVEGV